MLLDQATTVSRKAVESIKERTQSKEGPDYFYWVAGGVPAGPIKLASLIERVQAGSLSETLRVAEVGSETWLSLTEVNAVRQASPTQAQQA